MQDIFNSDSKIILIYIAVFITALIIVWQSIPSVIYVAKRKRLLDKPTGRKKHANVTPNLAGIAIFAAVAFVCALFQVGRFLPEWNYIFAGAFLLFVTGLKDDLVPMSAYKKFMAQFGAAFIIVVLADLRIKNLHGFLGIYHIPYIVSAVITFLIITFVTNAYNLIDGVDGLAGTQGLLGFLFLGVFFSTLGGNYGLSMVCFCMVGALIGFLRYNLISPARIFMGDTGSLQIGYLLSITSVAIIDKYEYDPVLAGSGGIGLAVALLFIPAFDTLRVFITRILKGNSPFAADRTHIHHILLDTGFKSKQIVITLAMVKILFISVAFILKDYNPTYTISLLLLIALVLMTIAMNARNRHLGQKAPLIPVNERLMKKLDRRSKEKAALKEKNVKPKFNTASAEHAMAANEKKPQ